VYLQQIAIVGLGGFLGSALRFMISGWVHRAIPLSTFPYGTMVVNVTGCLLIGYLGGLVDFRQMLEPGQRLFLIIGVLGGFTTFSTFAFETMALARDAELFRAAVNILLQVILGCASALVGYVGARLT
jgi:CrcB protein